MSPLDSLPPEEHRRRYEALRDAARTRAASQSGSIAPAPLDPASIIATETIPGGWYHTLRLRRGQALRLHNLHATAGIAVVLWNPHDPSERLNVPDTLKVQWTAQITTGRVLLSDMGRVMAAIIADDCGAHDGLVGGSASAATSPPLRNTRSNLLLAAGKHGLGPRDLPACFTFFAPVRTEFDGKLRWQDDVLQPGQSVDLLAAMDLLVALSTCPHPLAPAADPSPIEAITFHPTPDADRIARDAGPEAARAYERTEHLHAQ